MSPFLVYLLMMADDIKGVFGFLALLLGVAATGCFIGRAISSSRVYESDVREQSSNWGVWQAWVTLTKRLSWLFGLALIFSTFTPPSKTIAAMIVLPKITSPQAIDTVSKESRDIYELAKKALANLADGKPSANNTK